jgi:hypothetical protein
VCVCVSVCVWVYVCGNRSVLMCVWMLGPHAGPYGGGVACVGADGRARRAGRVRAGDRHPAHLRHGLWGALWPRCERRRRRTWPRWRAWCEVAGGLGPRPCNAHGGRRHNGPVSALLLHTSPRAHRRLSEYAWASAIDLLHLPLSHIHLDLLHLYKRSVPRAHIHRRRECRTHAPTHTSLHERSCTHSVCHCA